MKLPGATQREKIVIRPDFAPLLEHIGFSGSWVFTSPHVVVWRKLADRENCTLDAKWPDGRDARLHIKRYPAASGATARDEARGLEHLEKNQIPCPRLVAWGRMADGRGFVATEDLAGFEPADKLIARGTAFGDLLKPTADLAARLHSAGLHHRDLYLCHFFCCDDGGEVQAKLIDAARVRPLPGLLTRRRWIVKDLAQFWYSMTQLAISDPEQLRWLDRYVRMSKAGSKASLLSAIRAKVRRIAVHDAKLNRREPGRNVSIPTS